MSPLHGYRRLTLALTFLILSCQTLTAILLNRLPEDPLHLSTHLVFYSYLACLLSILGFIGARNGNATLVTIFSNYLIIDVFISAASRLLTLTFLPDLRASICSPDSIAAFLESHSLLVPVEEVDNTAAILLRQDTENSTRMQCNRVVSVLMVFASLATLTVTGIQILLAVRVSTYARILQQVEGVQVGADEIYFDETVADEEMSLAKMSLVEFGDTKKHATWRDASREDS